MTPPKKPVRAKKPVRGAGKLEKPAAEQNVDVLDAVAQSLTEVLRTLAFVSYKATEDSGDYNEPGNGGRRGVYKTYWENEYQFVFAAALFSIDADLQAAPLLRKLAKDSFKIYSRTLADKDACMRAYKERKSPSERIRGLRVLDGKRAIRLKPISWRDALARMKAEGFLVGWRRGLPAHLASSGGRSVLAGWGA